MHEFPRDVSEGQEDLRAAYSLSEGVLVPSKVEGFNLTTIESWLYRKPVVVSSGAGSSELVTQGVNGYVFDTSKPPELAEKVDRLLRRPEAAAKMGEQGYYSAKHCDINKTIKKVGIIFKETVDLFRQMRVRFKSICFYLGRTRLKARLDTSEVIVNLGRVARSGAFRHTAGQQQL